MDSSRQPRGSDQEEAGASSSSPPQGESSQAQARRPVPDHGLDQQELDATLQLLEENVIVIMTKELKRLFTGLENEEEPARNRDEGQRVELDEETKYMRKAFLGITVEFLRHMNENDLADRLLRKEQM